MGRRKKGYKFIRDLESLLSCLDFCRVTTNSVKKGVAGSVQVNIVDLNGSPIMQYAIVKKDNGDLIPVEGHAPKYNNDNLLVILKNINENRNK